MIEEDWLPELNELSEGMIAGAPLQALKQQSFFYLPRRSVSLLLDSKASAEHICAYIIVAKSRQGKSNYLVAGCNAVSKCLGIRPQKALRIYNELSTLKHGRKRLLIGFVSRERRETIKLKDFGDHKGAIRFPSSFVGHKSGAVEYPVSKLCKTGNIATRLLLFIYSKIDNMLGGYQASKVAETEHLITENVVNIVYGKASDFDLAGDLLGAVVGKQDREQDIKEALEKLLSLKLVESVVVVKVCKPENPVEVCCYDLHRKGEPLRGRVKGRIQQVVNKAGVNQGRKDGKSHDGVYHAIVPEGYSAQLVRVIRPVHRYIPPHHSPERTAELHRLDGNKWLLNWLEVLEGALPRDQISVPQVYFISLSSRLQAEKLSNVHKPIESYLMESDEEPIA